MGKGLDFPLPLLPSSSLFISKEEDGKRLLDWGGKGFRRRRAEGGKGGRQRPTRQRTQPIPPHASYAVKVQEIVLAKIRLKLFSS